MYKERQYYKDLIKTEYNYKSMLINFLKAYFFGGIVCIIGQFFYELYLNLLKFDNNNASVLMYITVIFIGGILTGVGIYDDLGQIARCGLAIPITGFANAMVSSAMEYHKEGIILGIAANAFKLAGSVIILGTSSAIIVSLIRFLMGWY